MSVAIRSCSVFFVGIATELLHVAVHYDILFCMVWGCQSGLVNL